MNADEQEVEIRLAVPNDAAAIQAILAEAFAEYESLYTKKGYAATVPEIRIIKNRFDEGEIWVVALEKKIVGTVSVISDDKSLYIRSMAILPEARGNKIGERLLECVENYAVRNSYQKLTLSTTPFLERAIALYKKFGFARAGSSNLHGTPLVKMEKNL